MSDDNQLIPDPKTIQRLMSNINRAREVVPDNPAGLKQYIMQWLLPTMGEMTKMLHTLSSTVGITFGGLQQLGNQVQMLSAQDGIMELASYVSGLQEALDAEVPDLELCRGTVRAMAMILEERFALGMSEPFEGTWEDEGDDSGEGETTPADPTLAPPTDPGSMPEPPPTAKAIPAKTDDSLSV